MLIGVTGRAQHGKDSTGRVLVEEFGYRRYAFADQLKSMALALNPIVQTYSFPKHPERLVTIVALLSWDKAKEIAEVRRFLQALGTEGVRDHLGDDAWVEALEKKMLNDGQLMTDSSYQPYAVLNPERRSVVTDVRFPNEAEWIHRLGGRLWRVKRVAWGPYGENPSPFDNGLGEDHPSEKYVDELPTDLEIVAETLDELEKKIREEMAWSED